MNIRLQAIGQFFQARSGKPVDAFAALHSPEFLKSVITPALQLLTDRKNISFIAVRNMDASHPDEREPKLYLASGFTKIEVPDSLKIAKVMLRRGLLEIEFHRKYQAGEAGIISVLESLFSNQPLPQLDEVNYISLESVRPIIGSPEEFRIVTPADWEKRLYTAGPYELEPISANAYSLYKVVAPVEGLKYAKALSIYSHHLEHEFHNTRGAVRMQMLAMRFLAAFEGPTAEINRQLFYLKQLVFSLVDPLRSEEERHGPLAAVTFREILKKNCFGATEITSRSLLQEIMTAADKLLAIENRSDTCELWSSVLSCSDPETLDLREHCFDRMMDAASQQLLTCLPTALSLWQIILQSRAISSHFKEKVVDVVLNIIDELAKEATIANNFLGKALKIWIFLFRCEIPKGRYVKIAHRIRKFTDRNPGVYVLPEYEGLSKHSCIFSSYLWARFHFVNKRYWRVFDFVQGSRFGQHPLLALCSAEASRKAYKGAASDQQIPHLERSIEIAEAALANLELSKTEGWYDDPWLKAELLTCRAFAKYQLLIERLGDASITPDELAPILEAVAQIRGLFDIKFFVPSLALVLEAYVNRRIGNTARVLAIANEILDMHPQNQAAIHLIRRFQHNPESALG